mmetsp:Transcript_27657/g.57539  ORF Transcript_27657/g.57539 Transcript_27657/m.57539 type:complete len:96 (-) Transcript_27657:475-762(-)
MPDVGSPVAGGSEQEHTVVGDCHVQQGRGSGQRLARCALGWEEAGAQLEAREVQDGDALLAGEEKESISAVQEGGLRESSVRRYGAHASRRVEIP